MKKTKAISRLLLPPLSLIDAWTNRRKLASTMLLGGGLGALIGPILALPLGFYLFGFFGSSAPLLDLGILPALFTVGLGAWGVSVLGRFVGFLLGYVKTISGTFFTFQSKEVLQAGISFAFFGNAVTKRFFHLFNTDFDARCLLTLETFDRLNLLRPTIRTYFLNHALRAAAGTICSLSHCAKFQDWLNDYQLARGILEAVEHHHNQWRDEEGLFRDLLIKLHNFGYLTRDNVVEKIEFFARTYRANASHELAIHTALRLGHEQTIHKLGHELDMLKECGLLIKDTKGTENTDNQAKIAQIERTFSLREHFIPSDLIQVMAAVKGLNVFGEGLDQQLGIIRCRYDASKFNSFNRRGLFSGEPSNALQPGDMKEPLSNWRKKRFFNLDRQTLDYLRVHKISQTQFDLIASFQNSMALP